MSLISIWHRHVVIVEHWRITKYDLLTHNLADEERFIIDDGVPACVIYDRAPITSFLFWREWLDPIMAPGHECSKCLKLWKRYSGDMQTVIGQ